MPDPKDIDGVLVQWGDRLFYLGNRIVKECRDPRLASRGLRARAAVIRQRIEATVIRRTTQVMAKVTGGGRGMKAIAAHFRYIGKKGRLDIEDEQGNVERGKNAVKELVKDWRFGGSFIAETSDRREAFNVMLSMPRGTDPLSLLRAARGGCPTRARGSQVRAGASRTPGQSACPHQRACGVEARQAAPPPEGRPPSLAGDLRADVTQLGCRCRSQSTGDPWRGSQLPLDLADEGCGSR